MTLARKGRQPLGEGYAKDSAKGLHELLRLAYVRASAVARAQTAPLRPCDWLAKKQPFVSTGTRPRAVGRGNATKPTFVQRHRPTWTLPSAKR